MQITTFREGKRSNFSTEDVSAFLDFVRDELAITDQEHLRRLFEITCGEVGALGVGFTARSSKLALALGEKLLRMHTPDDPGGAKSKALIESLSRQFHSHQYPVSRKEALEMELPVNRDRDKLLETLMWSLWLDLEEELQERQPFSPITELLNSSQAAKLLSPVPQLTLPMNAAGPTYFQANIPDVENATKSDCRVDPVDFSHINAMIESARSGFHEVTRGEILASRMPDLNIRFNCLVTFRGWENAGA